MCIRDRLKYKENFKHKKIPILTTIGDVQISGSLIIADSLISTDCTVIMGGRIFLKYCHSFSNNNNCEPVRQYYLAITGFVKLLSSSSRNNVQMTNNLRISVQIADILPTSAITTNTVARWPPSVVCLTLICCIP